MSNQLGAAPGGAQLATQPTSGSGGGGGVSSVTASSPISSSGGATPNISLDASGVTAGSYTNASLTVTAKGIVTAASSGTAPVTSVTGTAPIASSGGATPAISIADTAVTPGSYTNASLTVDQKGRLTAASSGTAPVTSVTGTAPITSSGGATPTIGVNNTGTTVGRAGLEVLIDRATLSSAASYSSPSWAAGTYRSLRFVIRGTGGTTTAADVTLTGLTGTYKSSMIYAGPAAVGVIQWSANWYTWLVAPLVAQGTIVIEKNAIRGWHVDYASTDTSLSGAPTTGEMNGSNDDTTHDVTQFNLTAGSGNMSGTVELWGLP